MGNLYYYIIILFLFVYSICSCKKEKVTSALVTYNVGFEELKNCQGVFKNNGDEEIYFFKSKFNPQVKFCDLEGNIKDSLSLQWVEDSIGRIGRFTVVSRDTMIAVSYQTDRLVGLRRDGSFIFKIDLPSLSALEDDNEYCFWGNFTPSPIHIGDNILFLLMWNGKHKNKYQPASQSDYNKYSISNRMHSPLVAKIEAVYSDSPRVKFGLRDHYYNHSSELTSYGATGINYAILNNKLFFILANERNIYELDTNTLNIVDTVLIIPQKYEIPLGVKFIGNPNISEDMMSEKELMDKCRITNMLYCDAKKQYYVFLKTGKELSVVDEVGYPFKLFVYDEGFTKKKEYTFDTNVYNPKTAMMTSKGIMIEKTIKNQVYGKKSFEFIDL